MKIAVITQARLSSTRLPNKVLQKVGDYTLLDLHLYRLKKCKKIQDVIVATTNEIGSEQICKIAESNGCLYFQGNLDDVLDRYYQAAALNKVDVVVRATSDCPYIDPEYVDDLVNKFLASNVDYMSNNLIPNLPDGMDAEIFNFKTLEKAWKEAKLNSEREHVTSYIWKNCNLKNGHIFTAKALDYKLGLEGIRLTVDQTEDLKLINLVYAKLGKDVKLNDIISFLNQNSELMQVNSFIERNEGYKKSLEKESK